MVLRSWKRTFTPHPFALLPHPIMQHCHLLFLAALHPAAHLQVIPSLSVSSVLIWNQVSTLHRLKNMWIISYYRVVPKFLRRASPCASSPLKPWMLALTVHLQIVLTTYLAQDAIDLFNFVALLNKWWSLLCIGLLCFHLMNPVEGHNNNILLDLLYAGRALEIWDYVSFCLFCLLLPCPHPHPTIQLKVILTSREMAHV